MGSFERLSSNFNKKQGEELRHDEADGVAWEQPDTTGLGKITQDRPRSEKLEIPQADEEGIAWEQPDTTGLGKITQDRIPMKQTEYVAMDKIDYDPNKATERSHDVWEDPQVNKEVSKMDWDKHRAA